MASTADNIRMVLTSPFTFGGLLLLVLLILEGAGKIHMPVLHEVVEVVATLARSVGLGV